MPNLSLLPVVSEKAMAASQNNNVYAFIVPKAANKMAIAQAISAKFGVKVTTVRTAVIKGKPKQMSVQRGKQRLSGRRSDFKKAYIKLAAGESIKLFETKEKK